MKKEIEILYTAYVETEKEKGFINYEYGQGECLLFLVNDIEKADFFDDKETILNELTQDNCNFNKIDFYVKKITKITELSKTD